MCQTTNRDLLRNGHAADLATQGHGIADIIDGMKELEKRVDEIPTRSEVQQMIDSGLGIHIKTCAEARPKPAQPEPVEFHLGKGGLEMKGRAAMLAGSVLGGAVVFFLVKAIPYIKEWVALWKGGTP